MLLRVKATGGTLAIELTPPVGFNGEVGKPISLNQNPSWLGEPLMQTDAMKEEAKKSRIAEAGLEVMDAGFEKALELARALDEKRPIPHSVRCEVELTEQALVRKATALRAKSPWAPRETDIQLGSGRASTGIRKDSTGAEGDPFE